MKKILALIMIILTLSVPAFADVPERIDGSDIYLLKETGDLESQGSSALYGIYKQDGGSLSNFYDTYEFIVDVNLPLSVSKIDFSDAIPVFEVKVLDSCDVGSVNYNGKITIKNSITGEQTVLNISGTATSEAFQVSGDVTIGLGEGNNLYDFSSAPSSTRVIFGDDVDIQTNGVESGIKCFTYNINPSTEIMNKYSLNTGNSAFVNFVGNPEFENKITGTMMVPINSENPKLYQLKTGSINELEEMANYSIKETQAGKVIEFESMNLSEKYVITAGVISGAVKGTDTVDTTGEQTTQVGETNEEVNDDVTNPKTGSGMAYKIFALAALLLTIIITAKMSR